MNADLSVNAKEMPEAQIAAIHHVEGARFEGDPVQRQHVVRVTVGNVDMGGNAAAQIRKRMHLDRAA